MSRATEDFIDDLVERFPGLRPVLEEHLSDNFGELLPHVFFGDVTRYIVSRHLDARLHHGSGPEQAREEVRSLLKALETAYVERGEEVEELIAVSFLENLPRPGEPGADLRECLGPAMTHQLRVIG